MGWIVVTPVALCSLGFHADLIDSAWQVRLQGRYIRACHVLGLSDQTVSAGFQTVRGNGL